MLFGYGRVSTKDQNLDLQVDALKAAGCDKIFVEKITGTKKNRPELEKLFAQLRAGDVVVVWKLSRWGRSTKDLIELTDRLRELNVEFRCLTMNLDTTTPTGRLFFNIMAAFAEFDRDTIVENTNAGLAAARARGRTGGRKPGLSDEGKLKSAAAKTLYENGNTIKSITKNLKISKRTLYKYLELEGVKVGSAAEAQ